MSDWRNSKFLQVDAVCLGIAIAIVAAMFLFVAHGVYCIAVGMCYWAQKLLRDGRF